MVSFLLSETPIHHVPFSRNWERSGRNLAANGAVMRTPVIGALLYQDKDEKSGYLRTFEAATAVASTTHADPRCLVSCTIASGIVAAVCSHQNHYIST